jgi:hypothetical protein
MDFIKFIRSLEEFLYEVLAWILFYPRTLWMVIVHPIRSLQYTVGEERETLEEKYADTVSPPLFLMLTLIVAHLIEMLAHVRLPSEMAGQFGRLMASDQNLLIFRSLLFALFPLMFAAEQVALSRQSLTRQSLRTPFFGQCYLGSLLTLLLSIASIVARMPTIQVAGWAIMAASFAWYVSVQAVWFSMTYGLSPLRSVAVALRALFKAVTIIAVAGLIIGIVGS